MEITDPDEKYLSHNFVDGKSLLAVMNWASFPYECVNPSAAKTDGRTCPVHPQGNKKSPTA